MLIILDQAVVQPLLVRLDRFAPVINLSGRQRMLSQRLTKSALIIDRTTSERTAEASREELKVTLKQWRAAHQALQYGDPSLGIERISSPTIQLQWEEIEPHPRDFGDAARLRLGPSERESVLR